MQTPEFIKEIEADVAALYNKFQDNPTVHTVEVKAKAIGSSALAYIETNGGQAAYNIAISILTGAISGTPWATLGASLVTQAETAGITIAKGAESVILAQAQADLISQGSIPAPTTGLVVAPAPVVEPQPVIPVNAPIAAATGLVS